MQHDFLLESCTRFGVFTKVEFYPPNNIRRDMDNYFKALFDSLTTAGVWVDDSQIKRIESDWFDPIINGKVIIYILKVSQSAD